MTDETAGGGSGGTSAVTTAAVAARTWPSHRVARHWLPWVLPLMAIGLPLLCSVIAASMSANTWTLQFAAASSDRGDLVIPALIICAESLRRWSYDVKGGYLVGVFALFAILVCAAAVIVSLITFADASIRTSAQIVNTVTWGSFAAGFITGSIAVALTKPSEAGA